jgi:hypothetical protein
MNKEPQSKVCKMTLIRHKRSTGTSRNSNFAFIPHYSRNSTKNIKKTFLGSFPFWPLAMDYENPFLTFALYDSKPSHSQGHNHQGHPTHKLHGREQLISKALRAVQQGPQELERGDEESDVDSDDYRSGDDSEDFSDGEFSGRYYDPAPASPAPEDTVLATSPAAQFWSYFSVRTPMEDKESIMSCVPDPQLSAFFEASDEEISSTSSTISSPSVASEEPVPGASTAATHSPASSTATPPPLIPSPPPPLPPSHSPSANTRAMPPRPAASESSKRPSTPAFVDDFYGPVPIQPMHYPHRRIPLPSSVIAYTRPFTLHREDTREWLKQAVSNTFLNVSRDMPRRIEVHCSAHFMDFSAPPAQSSICTHSRPRELARDLEDDGYVNSQHQRKVVHRACFQADDASRTHAQPIPARYNISNNNNHHHHHDHGNQGYSHQHRLNLQNNDPPVKIPIATFVVHNTFDLPLRLPLIRMGWMHKRSDTLRVWRWRWVVLTPEYLYSFKSSRVEDEWQRPTMILRLADGTRHRPWKDAARERKASGSRSKAVPMSPTMKSSTTTPSVPSSPLSLPLSHATTSFFSFRTHATGPPVLKAKPMQLQLKLKTSQKSYRFEVSCECDLQLWHAALKYAISLHSHKQ